MGRVNGMEVKKRPDVDRIGDLLGQYSERLIAVSGKYPDLSIERTSVIVKTSGAVAFALVATLLDASTTLGVEVSGMIAIRVAISVLAVFYIYNVYKGYRSARKQQQSCRYELRAVGTTLVRVVRYAGQLTDHGDLSTLDRVILGTRVAEAQAAIRYAEDVLDESLEETHQPEFDLAKEVLP